MAYMIPRRNYLNILRHILPVILLTLAVPLTVFVALQSQDNRQQASQGAEIYLIPSSQTVAPGESLSLTAQLNAKQTAVDAVQMHLSYPQHKLKVITVDDRGSSFPIPNEELTTNGLIRISREASIPVTGEVKIVTITFNALQNVSALEIRAINEQTAARRLDKQYIPVASRLVDVASSTHSETATTQQPFWNIIPTILGFFQSLNPLQ